MTLFKRNISFLMSRWRRALEISENPVVPYLIPTSMTFAKSSSILAYDEVIWYGSVWRKRMALVAIELTRSRHASAQDEEIA